MVQPKIHPSNLVFLAICILGIAIFLLVAVYPNSRTMKEMDSEIADLNQKVQNQELLLPVFRELIKEVTQKVPAKLPLPDKGKISPNDLARINKMFSDLATESGVAFNSAIPDPSSYLDDTGYLTLNVSFIGDFFNLRKVLLDICRLPYLESMEQIRLQTENQGKRMRLKLRIAQE